MRTDDVIMTTYDVIMRDREGIITAIKNYNKRRAEDSSCPPMTSSLRFMTSLSLQVTIEQSRGDGETKAENLLRQRR